MRRIKHRNRGFTLIEVLVVIMIISMLAVFVAPKMLKQVGKSKKDIAKAQMGIIETAIDRFYLDCGRYPNDASGLEELLFQPNDLEGKWNGQYLKRSQILDPWKNPYVFKQSGEINVGSYDLISYGADGQQGGEGDNEDITNE